MTPDAPGGTPLLLELDRSSDVPLYRQVYRGVREAILSGRLVPGARLPATRTLAEELDVSRMTVIGAYERLTAEGFLEARVGAGTWVAEDLRPELMPGFREHEGARTVSDRGRDITVLDGPTPRPWPEARPFQVGVPALDLFPRTKWARIASRTWRSAGHDLLSYGGATGLPELREAVTRHLASSRGVECAPDEVIVVEGTQQGVDLAARVLLDQGDRAWIEEPGYPGASGAIVSAGAKPVPIPVDEDGLDVDRGQALAPAARLVYVTPSHQFPTGVVTSLPRRLALLRWAEAADAWILEDDYDSEYRYDGRPLTALQGLDTSRRVIYLGSFSKSLSPALRLGYVIVPEDLVATFARARNYCGQHSPSVDQAVLAEFISEGHFARHLRRTRSAYEDRRAALLEALAEELSDRVEIGPATAGLHVACRLRGDVDDVAVRQAARERGVEVVPLSTLHAGSDPVRGLVLGYGCVPPERLREGVAVLGRALDAVADGA